jgi:hypothetical protein
MQTEIETISIAYTLYKKYQSNKFFIISWALSRKKGIKYVMLLQNIEIGLL